MAPVAKRNVRPMLSSLRCGARTRSNGRCMAPAVAGKKRCRMHGGAPGSGAPHGNQNARKHGLYTREAKATNRVIRAVILKAKKLLKDLSG